MKWMDRPSVTETIEEVSIKWIDRQSAEQMEMPLKWIKFNKIFWTGTKICYCI